MKASDKELLTEAALNKHLEKWSNKAGDLPPVAIGDFTLTKAGNIGLEVIVPTTKKYKAHSKELGHSHPLNYMKRIAPGDPTTVTTVIVVPPSLLNELIDNSLLITQDNTKNRLLEQTGVNAYKSNLTQQMPQSLTRITKQTNVKPSIFSNYDVEGTHFNDYDNVYYIHSMNNDWIGRRESILMDVLIRNDLGYLVPRRLVFEALTLPSQTKSKTRFVATLYSTDGTKLKNPIVLEDSLKDMIYGYDEDDLVQSLGYFLEQHNLLPHNFQENQKDDSIDDYIYELVLELEHEARTTHSNELIVVPSFYDVDGELPLSNEKVILQTDEDDEYEFAPHLLAIPKEFLTGPELDPNWWFVTENLGDLTLSQRMAVSDARKKAIKESTWES